MDLLLCKNCKQEIKIQSWLENCKNCSVLNHCCPGYMTTANVKHCGVHEAIVMLDHLNRQQEKPIRLLTQTIKILKEYIKHD